MPGYKFVLSSGNIYHRLCTIQNNFGFMVNALVVITKGIVILNKNTFAVNGNINQGHRIPNKKPRFKTRFDSKIYKAYGFFQKSCSLTLTRTWFIQLCFTTLYYALLCFTIHYYALLLFTTLCYTQSIFYQKESITINWVRFLLDKLYIKNGTPYQKRGHFGYGTDKSPTFGHILN